MAQAPDKRFTYYAVKLRLETMTEKEFERLKIKKGHPCIYKDAEEQIIAIDRTEGLFKLKHPLGDEWWVRFENVQLQD